IVGGASNWKVVEGTVVESSAAIGAPPEARGAKAYSAGRGRIPAPRPSAARSVLDDLEDVALLLLAARGRHDGADRGGVGSSLPDHLAEILLRHRQLEDVGLLADHFLDLDLLGLVHESLHDRLDELLHRKPLRAASIEGPSSGGGSAGERLTEEASGGWTSPAPGATVPGMLPLPPARRDKGVARDRAERVRRPCTCAAAYAVRKEELPLRSTSRAASRAASGSARDA